MNFENGDLSNWEINTGKVSVSTNSTNLITYSNSNWQKGQEISGRFQIMDRQMNLNPDFYGNFPVNSPDIKSRYSLKLGSDEKDPTSVTNIPNALVEAVRYKINVPKQAENFSINFSYAVVFENPNHPSNLHTYEQQPRFIARIYEDGGDTLICANYTYVASDSLPGWDTSTNISGRYPPGINYAIVKFKKWSSVFVNLSSYAGKTVFLEFITADCTKSGHFGYAYIDVADCGLPFNANISCMPPFKTEFTAPPGFKSYEWWDESYSQLIGTTEKFIKFPSYNLNDKVHLKLIPFSGFGCLDTLTTSVKAPYKALKGIRYKPINTVANLKTPLLARNIGTTYTWQPTEGLDATNYINPNYFYDKNKTYTVEITTTENCKTVDTQEVRIFNTIDIQVPRAFSPNGDGHNDFLDVYMIGLSSIKFRVFNRWGQLMFETTNPNQRWNGEFNGIKQQLETYVWIAEGIAIDGQKIWRRGQTILIR